MSEFSAARVVSEAEFSAARARGSYWFDNEPRAGPTRCSDLLTICLRTRHAQRGVKPCQTLSGPLPRSARRENGPQRQAS